MRSTLRRTDTSPYEGQSRALDIAKKVEENAGYFAKSFSPGLSKPLIKGVDAGLEFVRLRGWEFSLDLSKTHKTFKDIKACIIPFDFLVSVFHSLQQGAFLFSSSLRKKEGKASIFHFTLSLLACVASFRDAVGFFHEKTFVDLASLKKSVRPYGEVSALALFLLKLYKTNWYDQEKNQKNLEGLQKTYEELLEQINQPCHQVSPFPRELPLLEKEQRFQGALERLQEIGKKIECTYAEKSSTLNGLKAALEQLQEQIRNTREEILDQERQKGEFVAGKRLLEKEILSIKEELDDRNAREMARRTEALRMQGTLLEKTLQAPRSRSGSVSSVSSSSSSSEIATQETQGPSAATSFQESPPTVSRGEAPVRRQTPPLRQLSSEVLKSLRDGKKEELVEVERRILHYQASIDSFEQRLQSFTTDMQTTYREIISAQEAVTQEEIRKTAVCVETQYMEKLIEENKADINSIHRCGYQERQTKLTVRKYDLEGRIKLAQNQISTGFFLSSIFKDLSSLLIVIMSLKKMKNTRFAIDKKPYLKIFLIFTNVISTFVADYYKHFHLTSK